MLPFDPFIYTPYQYATVGQSVLTITKPMLADLVCFQSDSLWHVYRLNLAPNQWCYSFLCSAQIHHKLSCPHHTRSMHSSAWTSTNIVILLFTFSELFLFPLAAWHPQHSMSTSSMSRCGHNRLLEWHLRLTTKTSRTSMIQHTLNAVSCQISKWYIAFKIQSRDTEIL